MTQTIPGKAVDGALRIARLPADKILDVVPENRATASLGLVVDRADAAVRGAAASLLSDPALRDDADRRETAADKREQALRLRTKAEAKLDDAEARTQAKQAEAEQRRKNAEADAKKKREDAKKEAKKRKARAAKSAE